MVNLKNITDVPVAEFAEGLNLIVNDNGAAKQISANMLSSINDKVSALEAAVTALTPIVVRINGQNDVAPTIDKSFSEIVAHLQNGRKVEFLLTGEFLIGPFPYSPPNVTLQVSEYVAGVYVRAGSMADSISALRGWSIELRPNGLDVGTSIYQADNYDSNHFSGEYD